MKIEFRPNDYSRTLFLALLLVLAQIPASLNAQAPVQNPAPPARLTQPAPGTVGPTAGQYYKNVKVLKDIPAIDLHPAMEYITVALGVGCGYCHDPRKFDSDDKPTKRTARNMMQMMFAIDGTVFGGQERVTCYTCHRGEPKGAAVEALPGGNPQAGPTPADTYFATIAVSGIALDSSMAPVKPEPGSAAPPPAPPAAASAATPVVLPSVDEVFAKYAQTVGSPDAIKSVSTLVERGTVEMKIPSPPAPPGTPPAPPKVGRVDSEIYRKSPDKVLYLIHLPTALNSEGYDGFTAWIRGGAPREETGSERSVVQTKAEFFPALRFKDSHSQLKVDSIEKVGGRDAYRISGFRRDGTGFDHIDVDTQTGLLLRLSTNMSSVIGSFPLDIYYDDYRDVNGLKLPFTMREATPEGDRIYRWDRIEFNGQVEDTAFNMPPPSPPPPPGGTPAGGPSPAGGPPR